MQNFQSIPANVVVNPKAPEQKITYRCGECESLKINKGERYIVDNWLYVRCPECGEVNTIPCVFFEP